MDFGQVHKCYSFLMLSINAGLLNKSVHICGFKHRSAELALENSNSFHLFLLAVPVGKWIFYSNCERQDELCFTVPKLRRGTQYVVFLHNPVPSLIFTA